MADVKQFTIDGTSYPCKDETARRGVTNSYAGLCPQLPNDATKYLCGDGTWGSPSGTTYGIVSKTANGLCPQLPNETTTTKYLRQDGTWVAPPNTTYGVVSKTDNGLCPQLPNETTTTKYLRQDGTWSVPPDTNTTTGTTYNAGSAPANTTFGTNGSIKNVYDALTGLTTKLKDELNIPVGDSNTTFTISDIGNYKRLVINVTTQNAIRCSFELDTTLFINYNLAVIDFGIGGTMFEFLLGRTSNTSLWARHTYTGAACKLTIDGIKY